MSNSDYTIVEREINGIPHLFKMNERTGEVLSQGRYMPVFEDDLLVTAEQKAAREKIHEELVKKSRRRRIGRKNGKFFFIQRVNNLSALKPQTVARLIYLLTYADYSERGAILKLTQKRTMHTKDLPKVLGLSADSVAAFLKEVSPGYLKIEETGEISAQPTFFHRGAMRGGKSYVRLFDKSIRSLYSNTPRRSHCYIGYIFQLLLYLNIEWNVLCHNIDEDKLDHIECLGSREFCEKIQYSKAHFSRLDRAFKQLSFTVEDDEGKRTERFVSIKYDRKGTQGDRVWINPKILYNGSDDFQVEELAWFR